MMNFLCEYKVTLFLKKNKNRNAWENKTNREEKKHWDRIAASILGRLERNQRYFEGKDVHMHTHRTSTYFFQVYGEKK